jgi:hypothetical protein
MDVTSMRFLFVIGAAVVFLGAAVFWNLAMIFVLRFFRIDLPFSLPFRFHRRKEPELLVALKGRSINTYVVVSGLLLFACPLFAGLTAYEYVVRQSVEHSTYGLTSILESVASLVSLAIAGAWISIRNWQKSTESGIGLAMLALLVLKVSTDTVGGQAVVSLLIPAALCASFFYFGVRRIRRTSAGWRYPNRRDTGVTQDFIGERFVPSENYKAQQAMAQKLIAADLSHERLPGMPSGRPADLPSDERPRDQ